MRGVRVPPNGCSVLPAQFHKLIDRCRALLAGDRLLRGFGLLGLGEFIVRATRVLTAVALARMLDPVELGIAATAITCYELIRILANNGLGQMVVRATPAELDATCNTADWLIRRICIAMTVLQVAAGAVIAHVASEPRLFAMIACLAASYLTMPPGMVQSWLLQREQRMGAIAGISTTQTTADNLIAALLAVTGFGAWSIVLPKLLTTPVWLIGVRRTRPWQRNAAAGRLPLQAMWRYSAPILASEILGAVRVNADKMLVAAILGIEALGVYFFAFSAGYGLSAGLTGALTAASFPHLAATLSTRELLEKFDRAIRRLALPICVLVSLQASAIVVYVPLFFGAKWQPFVPIVMVLCLSAVTKPCSDLAVQLLRAAGMPGLELRASLVFTAALLASFALALPYGLMPGVIVIAVVSITLQAAFAWWARNQVRALLEDPPNALLPHSRT